MSKGVFTEVVYWNVEWSQWKWSKLMSNVIPSTAKWKWSRFMSNVIPSTAKWKWSRFMSNVIPSTAKWKWSRLMSNVIPSTTNFLQSISYRMWQVLNFIFCWSCISLQILANNQLDTLFHAFIYFVSRHVSSITVLIIRRSNCINTSSGMISLCKWLLGMPVPPDRHTKQSRNSIWSPDDEHCDA